MFCEKCGTQIPDGGEPLCANCRARLGGAQQNFAQPQYQQPVQPVQPTQAAPQQPVYQQPASNAGFSVNTILGNPTIVLALRFAFCAISIWAAFGPLLAYINFKFFVTMTTSFMGLHAMAGSSSPQFVPVLIFMILSILLSLAGTALVVISKFASQVKLPLPSFASYAATAGALLFSIISQFITIGFVSESSGMATFSGFGVFMMVLSFLALAGTVFLALPELKKK